MAKKIGDEAVVVSRGGEPVTLLPGQSVPAWAAKQVGSHALAEAPEADETDGGQPLQNAGTWIDGADPKEGVPSEDETLDPDLQGGEGDGGETPETPPAGADANAEKTPPAGAGEEKDSDAGQPDFTKPAPRASAKK